MFLIELGLHDFSPYLSIQSLLAALSSNSSPHTLRMIASFLIIIVYNYLIVYIHMYALAHTQSDESLFWYDFRAEHSALYHQ